MKASSPLRTRFPLVNPPFAGWALLRLGDAVLRPRLRHLCDEALEARPRVLYQLDLL